MNSIVTTFPLPLTSVTLRLLHSGLQYTAHTNICGFEDDLGYVGSSLRCWQFEVIMPGVAGT